MLSTRSVHNNKVAILISPGFAESDVVYCLNQMRMAGLPVSIVGLSKNAIASQHGLMVCPDYSLNELDIEHHFRTLIIPGSYECVNNLLTSPGFHDQLKEYPKQNGLIVILNDAEAALKAANLFLEDTEGILRQEKQPLDDFCQQLIQQFSQKPGKARTTS